MSCNTILGLRRWRLVIAVVIAGMLANTIVCWALTIIDPMDVYGDWIGVIDYPPGPQPTWLAMVETHATGSIVDARATLTTKVLPSVGAEVPRWSIINEPPIQTIAVTRTRVREIGRGWPATSMFSRSLSSSASKSTQFGLSVSWLSNNPLPLGIVVSGTIANTAVYAAIVALVVVLARRLRSAHRRSKGLCAECGYDCRFVSTGVCPECGALNARG